jgi:hypothetical protein
MDDTTASKLLELYHLEVEAAEHRKALSRCQVQVKALKQELGRKLSLVAGTGSVLLVPELEALGQVVWVDDCRSDDPISFVPLAHL